MMFLRPFTDPVTVANINFKMMNMNTPDATAPAIGNPTSDTNCKKFIIIYVFIGTNTPSIKRLTTKIRPAIL
tara:strand:- start:894 stop:1109 length:216 start_codon:yes stop_codon:yes gene_type:complete